MMGGRVELNGGRNRKRKGILVSVGGSCLENQSLEGIGGKTTFP